MQSAAYVASLSSVLVTCMLHMRCTIHIALALSPGDYLNVQM